MFLTIKVERMLTKELCIQKYEECKRSKNGVIPELREFLKFAGSSEGKLAKLFGSSPYSKLQAAAGDAPNKLQMERTPLATIMQQYGNLVIELGELPPYAEWTHRGLKPGRTGLEKSPHNMKWSELPARFTEWVTANKISGFDKALESISRSKRMIEDKPKAGDGDFLRLTKAVRDWTPDRRRSSEETYKVELRAHLKSLDYELNEEYGESKFDLLVRRKFAIEIKKDPDLGEYDRLFGQVARHLQHQCKVIVLILEASRKDKYDNFTALIERYLNVDVNSVEIIKKSG